MKAFCEINSQSGYINNNVEKCYVTKLQPYVAHICDVTHRHPTYVGALDFELWSCFVKIIFFANFFFNADRKYNFKAIKVQNIEDTLVLFLI